MQPRSQVIETSKTRIPPPGRPSTFAAGMRQPSKKSSLIGDVRRPIFESGWPTLSPGVPLSSRNAVTPANPSSLSIVAKTRKRSLSGAFVTKVFDPSRT